MKTLFPKSLFSLWLIVICVMTTTESVSAQTAQDDYAVAATHYSRGNWDESLVGFGELIDRHPRTEEAKNARFFLAEVMMQQREFGQAYRAFQIFLQENPQHQYSPRAAFRMGEAAFRTEKFDVALRVLEDFVKKNPHHELNEFALPYLGEMRLNREEPQLAQRAFETALQIFPTSSMSNSSRLGLAKALQIQGHASEANRFYQFLLTQDDSALQGDSHLQLGISCFGNHDFETAESHLRQAMASCQSQVSQSKATYWLARTYNESGDHERAIELLKTIVDVELPEKLAVAALFDGAVAATKTGQEKLALRWLSQIRDSYPHHVLADDSIRMAIDIHQRRGEADDAQKLIQQFLTQHKNSPLRAGVLESEGRSHYSAQRYAQMIKTFETLLSEYSGAKRVDAADIANWHYLKSLGHLGLGEFENAENELSRVDPSDQGEELATLVHIALATARFGNEDYQAAIEDYRNYLRQSNHGSEQKRARTELVVCLAETSRWDEAAAAFEELRSSHEGDQLVLSTAEFLAERSFEENRFNLAERWFALMAQSGNPKDTIARGLSGLAWIKMESKDKQSAAEVFKRLLTEFPDSKFSGEAAMARAKFLEDQQDFNEAAQTYGLVIRQFGSSPMTNVAKLRRAYALQKLDGRANLNECEILLKEYLALPSGNPLADEAQYQLGWVLQDLGRTDEGLKQFVELVESDPESKYWSDAAYRVIQDAVEKRDHATAKPLIERVLAKSNVPEQIVTRVLFVRGQIAASENQWGEVAESMQQFLQRDEGETTKAKARYWLAESLYRQKKYADALPIFLQLNPVATRFNEKRQPWILLRTAQCYGRTEDWVHAVEIAEAAVQQFPGFEAEFEFDFVLGRGLEDAGKLTDARIAYQRVIESVEGGSTETAAIAQWRIGETYFHQEDYTNAIKSYHKVDSLFSYRHWRSAALFQAGKCQEHLSNHNHAIKLYSQLIEGFPESEFVIGARQRLDQLTSQAKVIGADSTVPTARSQSR